MSRTSPSRYERVALMEQCPACRAVPDHWCIVANSTDRPTAELHSVRGRALMEAYWAGFDDGVADQYARQQSPVLGVIQ